VLDKLQPVHLGHVKIGHHQQRLLGANVRQTGASVDRHGDPIPRILQDELHVRGLRRTVFDQQD
jgi:hypothetical protein